MRPTIILLCALLLLGIGQSGLCLDLQTAKAQGLVGETPTGYLAVVGSGHAEATALALSINAQRKQQYEEIAQRNNTPLKTVEALAGKKAIDMTPAGQFIQLNGAWTKK